MDSYFSAINSSLTDYFCFLPTFETVLMGPRLKTNFYVMVSFIGEH